MDRSSTVPGSEMNIDWRAVVVGGGALGVLCAVPVLAGWVVVPTPASESVSAAATAPNTAAETEGPSLLATAVPFAVGAPGPFIAGYLARRDNLEGAVEGMLSVPLGASIPIGAVMLDRFLLYQGMGIGMQIELLWRGVGFYAVVAVLFVPLVCALGAALGWVGRLTRDAVRGGVTVSWS